MSTPQQDLGEALGTNPKEHREADHCSSSEADDPMSPGLLMIKQFRQTAASQFQNTAPIRPVAAFKFPDVDVHDADDAFPFQLAPRTTAPPSRQSQKQLSVSSGPTKASPPHTSQRISTRSEKLRSENAINLDAQTKVSFAQDDSSNLGLVRPIQAGDREEDEPEHQIERETSPSPNKDKRMQPSSIPEAADIEPIQSPRDNTTISSVSSPVISTGKFDCQSQDFCTVQEQAYENSNMKPISSPITVADVNSTGPTEEDLLMLLQRQSRARKQENNRLHSHCRVLKSQGLILKKNHVAATEHIRHITAEVESIRKHNIMLQGQLGTFKIKYTKLKAWAVEMNQEYASLRLFGESVTAFIEAAEKDRAEIIADTRDVRDVLNKAEAELNQLKHELSITRDEIIRCEKDKDSLQVQLNRTNQALLQEQVRNKQYAQHIQHLESAHEKTHNLIGQTNVELGQVSTILSRLEEVKPNEKLNESLTSISGLRKMFEARLAAEKEGDDEFRKMLCEQFTVMQTMWSNVKCSAGEIEQQHSEQLQQILQAVQKLLPDLEHQNSLNMANASLQERQKAMERMEKSLRNDKTATLLHLTGVIEAHKQLLAKTTDAPGTAQGQEIGILQTRLDQAQVMHTQKTDELLQSQQQLAIEKQNLIRLNAELASLKDQAKFDLLKVKEEFEKQVALEIKSKEVAVKNLSSEHKTTLEQRDHIIQTMQREVSARREEREELEAQKRRLEQQIQQKDQSVQQQHMDIVASKEQISQLMEDRSCMSKQLEAAEVVANQVSQLEAEIRELRGIKSRAHQYEQEVERLATKNSILTSTVENKSSSLHLAEQRINTLEEEVSRLCEKIKRLEKAASDRDDLVVELGKMQAEANKVCTLTTTVEGQEQMIEKLNHDMRQAQAVAAQIPGLQDQLQAARLENERFQTNLVDVYDKCNKCCEPEKVAVAGQEPVQDLNILAKRFEKNLCIVAALKKRESENEVQIKQLNAVIQSLTAKLSASVFHDDEELMDQFSQHVVLSQPNHHSEVQMQGNINDTYDSAQTPQAVNGCTSLMKTRGHYIREIKGQKPSSGLETEDISDSSFSQLEIPETAQDELAQVGGCSTPLSEHDSWFDDINLDEHNGDGIDEADFDGDDINAMAIVNTKPLGRKTANGKSPTVSDDMLLRSSVPPRGLGSPRVINNVQFQMQARTSGAEKSPVKLRSGHQVQLATRPANQAEAGGKVSPGAGEREPTRPNSAAKRCSVQASDGEPKRLKRNVENLAVRKRGRFLPSGAKSRSDSPNQRVYDLPSGSRSGANTSDASGPAPAPAGGRCNQNRSKTSRKNSKENKYSQRFSSQA